MATEAVAMVTTVESVKVHPNADRLDIVSVLGWQVVSAKDTMKAGQPVLFIPPDMLVPKNLAEKWGVLKYLKGPNCDRVGKIRLRGEPSLGLVVQIPLELSQARDGENVAAVLGIVKYEPPMRMRCEDAESPLSLFTKYTDIENLRNYPHAFEDGELVVATEKIHGTNSRVGVIDGVMVAGSMEIQRRPPFDRNENLDRPAMAKACSSSTYWYPWSLDCVNDLLMTLSRSHKQVILYGEIFGKKIQSLSYGIPANSGVGFRAFDLLIDGDFVDNDELVRLLKVFGVDMVPILYEGPFSISKIKELSNGKSSLADHIREGVVVRPVVERFSNLVCRRLVMKYVGDDYLLGNESDFTEV